MVFSETLTTLSAGSTYLSETNGSPTPKYIFVLHHFILIDGEEGASEERHKMRLGDDCRSDLNLPVDSRPTRALFHVVLYALVLVWCLVSL